MITTAADGVMIPFARNRLLQLITAGFAAAWLIGAISPENRFDWLLENLLLFLAVGLLGYFYRTRPLSDVSYLLIAAFLILHTVGAHYTYSKVPLGFWLKDALGLERNHFDRVIHFCFGLLIIYPVRETLVRFAGAGRALSAFAAFTVIATSSLTYEIIEWIVAIVVNPQAAMAYLGTQGDAFDSQKDSALAITGAVLALWVTAPSFKRYSR